MQFSKKNKYYKKRILNLLNRYENGNNCNLTDQEMFKEVQEDLNKWVLRK